MKYRTIVADPPWPYPEGFGVGIGREAGKARRALPYPSMTLDEIAALPVESMAAESAHLYLWTTNRYMRAGLDTMRAWGFKHGQTLVWCKPPRTSFLGGGFGSNVEFVLFGRRGKAPNVGRVNSCWWEWPRSHHSRKPEAFLDMVELVSEAPRIEMFARRQRLGWDTWGNEAFNHVELGEPS